MTQVTVTKEAARQQHIGKRVVIAVVLLVVLVAVSVALGGVDAQDAVVITTRDEVPDAEAYTWTLVSDGFDNPLFVTHAGDGSGRLFVLEQTGMIWIVQGGVQLDEPFLDISAALPPAVLRGGYSEQGLLGLAFHPDYAENGVFFISYTDTAGDSVISRMRVSTDNPNVADDAVEEVLLFIDQPFENHNSGHIAFGPDGYLYISMGDGGDQGDPFGNAQDPEILLGKILRIDVDNGDPYGIPDGNASEVNPAFAPEIWLMGFRNPWRFAFDRATNDFYTADVGEWLEEEINFYPAGSPAGANFGWEFYEGNLFRDGEPPENLVEPVATYAHNLGCSVTGGYVYRGEMLPEMQGYYFYGDYCLGNLWLMYRDGSGVWQNALWMQTMRQISSFGEDEAGELYMVDYKGELLRLEAVP
ncbi:MAG: PQQ-dependent sugar dehydrogenase [Chloroflexota bacterium]|nr:PQQ-dependent sugar dehydrogenase [Chloroflexota bacterium]